jgi:hypothetical protein
VRRERKGGKSAEKQGVVTIDLTMFASSSEAVEKRYLLQAGSNFNSKKQGKDNSVLQISVSMHQQEGAPVYVNTYAVSHFTCFLVVCASVYVDAGALSHFT